MDIFNSQAKSALNKLLIVLLSSLTFTANAFLDPFDCEAFDPPYMDPLIVDLGQDGIHLGQKGHGVMFDLYGTGTLVKSQWTAPQGNEAFLIYDKNGNGLVDSGLEMFTNYNPLILENRIAPNGFVDLAQYDQPILGGNDDGLISDDDQIWQELLLWLDKNADGVATLNEMLKLADVGLTRLNTIPKDNNRQDPAGNRLPLWAWAKADNVQGNSKFKMVDVFFKALD